MQQDISNNCGDTYKEISVSLGVLTKKSPCNLDNARKLLDEMSDHMQHENVEVNIII